MIIVVLPAYNEVEALPILLGRLNAVSVGHFNSNISVIVVDDGSTDGTAERVRISKIPNVQLILHEKNMGLNEAVRTGLLAATQSAMDDNDVIVTMDADNTHVPALISRMVMLIEEGNEVVIASRYVPGARVVGLAWHRRLLSLLASVLFRYTFPMTGVKDYTCGFRAYRAGLLKEAFERWGNEFISEPGFSCMVDILLKCRRLDAIANEVPLILRYDFKPSESKMKVFKTIKQTLSLLVRRRFKG
ncbi:MAG: hypothetical protein BWK78_07900 [Thiotrichaceae bacterium IS1]|nr:MAG: hypothetical protein BWK78_07900 [Thiotrichaceae bacterium IS1]